MTKIFALSETTGKLEPCTMAVGILLDSGERVGHMADVDLFNTFNIDVYDAIGAINRKEGTTYNQGEPGVMLWRCNRRKRVFKGEKRTAYKQPIDKLTHKERVELYAYNVAAGLPLYQVKASKVV
jgi:hypothetical protein